MPASRPPILLQLAVEPRDTRDWPRLVAALGANDDGNCEIDEQAGRVLLGSASEAEVDALVAEVRERAGIALKVAAPQVAYRETISRRIEMDTTHKKARDGVFEFARVKLAFAPVDGWHFIAPVSGAFPKTFVAGVEAALVRGRRAGVLAGFPVVDIEATLLDGAWHDTGSSPAAFETATLTAFRLAQRDVGVLMEPVMTIALTVPTVCAATVRDDLLLRHAKIARRVAHANGTVTFDGTVPLANIFGYRNSVRAMSGDIGSYALAFSHYEAIPRSDPPDFPEAMAMRA